MPIGAMSGRPAGGRLRQPASAGIHTGNSSALPRTSRSRSNRVAASVSWTRREAMDGTPRRRLRLRALFGAGVLSTALLTAVGATHAGSAPAKHDPLFTEAVAFDTSKPLRELAKAATASARRQHVRLGTERGPTVKDKGFSGDAAVQDTSVATAAATIGGMIANFEGLG